jgi:hypothetical protein
MADFIGVSFAKFLKRYCRRVFERISLIEYSNGDCVFYSPSGCKVYPVRPAQCQTFPFWSHVMADRSEWEALAERCPGIGSGRLYEPEEIEAIMNGERTT